MAKAKLKLICFIIPAVLGFKASAQDLSTFSNPFQKIEFQYPTNWETATDSLIGDNQKIYYYTVILYSPEHANGDPETIKSNQFVTISVDVSALSDREKRLNAAKKNVVATVEEMRDILNLPDIELEESKETLLGKKAYLIKHPVYYGEEYQLFTILKDKKYVVSLRGSEELNEKYHDVFQQVSASLTALN